MKPTIFIVHKTGNRWYVGYVNDHVTFVKTNGPFNSRAEARRALARKLTAAECQEAAAP